MVAGKRINKTYRPEERKAAIALAKEVGLSEGARRLGIPKGTVSSWCFQDRRAGPQKNRPGETGDATSGQGQAEPKEEPEGALAQDGEVTAGSETKTAPGRVGRSYTPSQRAQMLEYAAEHGIGAASKHFKVSRYALYDWRRRVERAAQGRGDDPTSGPAQQDIEAQRDQEILAEWKRHPGLGPSQIRNQLRRKGIKVSVHTTRRVMEEAGYRPPKVKREPHDERFEAVRPNHLWHLDFVQRFINRASTFTLVLLDDHSRYVVGHGVDDAERADLVIETFEKAVERHGKPEMVINDKGSAFWSWRGIARFTALLTELGVDQIEAKHKEWNGKLEVFNANLHKEFFDRHRFYDVAEMRRRLASHLHWYNHGRTSHALGGLLVPADRYYAESSIMRSVA